MVHVKSHSNAKADNTQVVVCVEEKNLYLSLHTLHHKWWLPAKVPKPSLFISGPRFGMSIIFNEYKAKYQHDRENVTFIEQDYRNGSRAPTFTRSVQHGSYLDDAPDILNLTRFSILTGA